MEHVKYDSPTILKLEDIDEPLPWADPAQRALPDIISNQPIACLTCPGSLWYWQGKDKLTCWCSVLHRETFDSAWKAESRPFEPVFLCDGREQGLARLALATKQD